MDSAPLIELDTQVLAITQRLERDYLAASLQSHSLRERLWDAGYDWAMRFNEAYRALLTRQRTPVAGRAASQFAQVAARFSISGRWRTAIASTANEEWIPGLWTGDQPDLPQDPRPGR